MTHTLWLWLLVTSKLAVRALAGVLAVLGKKGTVWVVLALALVSRGLWLLLLVIVLLLLWHSASTGAEGNFFA